MKDSLENASKSELLTWLSVQLEEHAGHMNDLSKASQPDDKELVKKCIQRSLKLINEVAERINANS